MNAKEKVWKHLNVSNHENNSTCLKFNASPSKSKISSHEREKEDTIV